MKALDSLDAEFRAVDYLVACNTSRVLKAFQNARVGSHVSIYIICYLVINCEKNLKNVIR